MTGNEGEDDIVFSMENVSGVVGNWLGHHLVDEANEEKETLEKQEKLITMVEQKRRGREGVGALRQKETRPMTDAKGTEVFLKKLSKRKVVEDISAKESEEETDEEGRTSLITKRKRGNESNEVYLNTLREEQDRKRKKNQKKRDKMRQKKAEIVAANAVAAQKKTLS